MFSISGILTGLHFLYAWTDVSGPKQHLENVEPLTFNSFKWKFPTGSNIARVIIIGEYVDDFVTIKKDKLYALGWAGINALISKNEDLQVRVNTLESELVAKADQSTTYTKTEINHQVQGALSKGSGIFKIDHPLESKKNTHKLVHSFVEAPKADLIYRGKVSLVNGTVEVNIDTVAGMTEGTFTVLCDDIQCFTTNETDWGAVKGKINGNGLSRIIT